MELLLRYGETPTEWAERTTQEEQFFVERAWFARRKTERERAAEHREELEL